jgi:hypothetical protein
MDEFNKTQKVEARPHIKLFVFPDKENGGYIIIDKNGVGYHKVHPTLEMVHTTAKELEEKEGVEVKLFLQI